MATTRNNTAKKTPTQRPKVVELPRRTHRVSDVERAPIQTGIPIPKDSAKWADSRVSRIAALEIGGVEPFIKQIDTIDITDTGSIDDTITNAVRQMHSNLGAAANRAGDRIGGKFSVNVTPQMIASPYRLIVLGTVTRTA